MYSIYIYIYIHREREREIADLEGVEAVDGSKAISLSRL